MTVKWSDGGRRVLAAVALCAGLLASSCGGSSTSTKFIASRVVTFGDESSMLVDLDNDSNSAKYSVNATVSTTDPTRVCALNPLWNQSVAASFGLVFAECNQGSGAVTAPVSRIRAAVGAHAADISAQIDAQQADVPLGAGDMVTLLIGTNDIISQYQLYPTLSEVDITGNLTAAGAEAGRQVNRLADLGAKVLIATAPDIGVTPFAYAERAAHADTDRAALLRRLTQTFNTALRTTMYNDGRRIGLILLDELIDTIVANPGLDGFTNNTDAVCDLNQSKLIPPSILDCTSLTFVPNGSAAYLWADDRHLSASGQGIFGSNAVTRAQNNSF
jgi:outer membrane lipase/esterase